MNAGRAGSGAMQTFAFEPVGMSVRVILRDGAPWFIAADVAKAMGYSNPSKALRDHVAPRGRPAVALDNRRVSAYLSNFTTLSELTGLHPSMGDIFTGVSRLQTEGQGSTRPLSRRQLFHVLSMCDHITADAVAQALGDVSLRHAQRYAGHARVASKAIARLLDQRPWLEAAVSFWTPAGRRQTVAEAQTELDEPYFAELRAAGLM